ncbi:MAG: hypothetical protein VCD31_15580 [Alphaproteobacteria bacterium]
MQATLSTALQIANFLSSGAVFFGLVAAPHVDQERFIQLQNVDRAAMPGAPQFLVSIQRPLEMKISGVGFLGLPIELSQFGKARGNELMLCAERLFP